MKYITNVLTADFDQCNASLWNKSALNVYVFYIHISYLDILPSNGSVNKMEKRHYHIFWDLMHALLNKKEVQRKQTGFKVYRSMTLTGVNADVKVHK